MVVSASCATSVRAQADVRRADVEAAVETVLESADFRHLRARPRDQQADDYQILPQWIEDFFEWLDDLLSGSSSSGGSSSVGSAGLGGALQVFMWCAIALILGLSAWLILRGVVDRAPRSEPAGLEDAVDIDGALALTGPPGELPASEYLRRARECAERGDFRLGVRLLLLGGMSWVERSGFIRFRKGLTNRDYLRATRRRPECRHAFGTIARRFEEIFFGRREPTAERFEECLQGFQDAFDEEPETSYSMDD